MSLLSLIDVTGGYLSADQGLPGSCSRPLIICRKGTATNRIPLREYGILLSKKVLSVTLILDNLRGLVLSWTKDSRHVGNLQYQHVFRDAFRWKCAKLRLQLSKLHRTPALVVSSGKTSSDIVKLAHALHETAA